MACQVPLTPVSSTSSPTQYVKKLRLHLKFLTGDFFTNERPNLDKPNISLACQLCHAPLETSEHVLLACSATQEVRSRLMPDRMNTVAKVQPICELLQYHPPASILAQLILNCSPLNLSDTFPVPTHNHLKYLQSIQRLDICNQF